MCKLGALLYPDKLKPLMLKFTVFTGDQLFSSNDNTALLGSSYIFNPVAVSGHEAPCRPRLVFPHKTEWEPSTSRRERERFPCEECNDNTETIIYYIVLKMLKIYSNLKKHLKYKFSV